MASFCCTDLAGCMLLFTRCATSNASRHFKSPLAMGRDAFKSKHASSVSISGVIDTGVNSNVLSSCLISIAYSFHFLKLIKLQSVILYPSFHIIIHINYIPVQRIHSFLYLSCTFLTYFLDSIQYHAVDHCIGYENNSRHDRSRLHCIR